MAFFPGATRDQMRAEQLVKRRQQEHEQIEAKKKKIEEENRMQAIEEKFKAHYDAVEQLLKSDTVGLVSLDEMKKKQEEMIRAREQQLAREKEAKLNDGAKNQHDQRKDANGHRKPNKLSFADEWEEEEQQDEEEEPKPSAPAPVSVEENPSSNDPPIRSMDENSNDSFSLAEPTPAELDQMVAAATKRKRLGKNPDVDTSFLPDKDREEEERILREKLRQEWVEKQQKLKNEEVDLVYSYWDGSGHRRSIRIKKKMTIQLFLTKALELLRRENVFNELKSASVDQLIFVKDDVILPHHYSFYDFIVTRARGRTGLLFPFTETIKLPTAIIEVPATATTSTGLSSAEGAPPSTETPEAGRSSHAGKICLRSWYERNKHIFPACRWEPYDPEKRWNAHEPVKNRFCPK